MRSSIQEAYEQIYLKEFNATSAVDKALSNFGAANKPEPKPAPVITSQKPTGTSGAAALGSMSISSPASARPTPAPAPKPTPTAPAPAASAPVRPTPTAPAPSTPTLSARAQALKAGGPMGGRRMLGQGFDIFDVIKGHLLDEGYADTEQAALVIMANMSEEWRQSILEQPSGSLMFTRRFGSSGLPGSTAATVNVSGGSPKGTQWSASGTGGYGTVSAQGDKINKGLSASIDNLNSGGGDKEWKGIPYRTPDADTSTSTIRKGAFGSLSANVSGGAARRAPAPAPTPAPKPVAPKPVAPKPTAASKPSAPQRLQRPTAADERLMGQNTPAGAAARERQAAFNRQNAADNARNPNISSIANVQTPYQAAKNRLVKSGITDDSGNAFTGSKFYLDKQLEGTPDQVARAASLSKDLNFVSGENLKAQQARSIGWDPGRLVYSPSEKQTVKVFGNNPLR